MARFRLDRSKDDAPAEEKPSEDKPSEEKPSGFQALDAIDPPAPPASDPGGSVQPAAGNPPPPDASEAPSPSPPAPADGPASPVADTDRAANVANPGLPATGNDAAQERPGESVPPATSLRSPEDAKAQPVEELPKLGAGEGATPGEEPRVYGWRVVVASVGGVLKGGILPAKAISPEETARLRQIGAIMPVLDPDAVDLAAYHTHSV